ncbi:glycoside hydrolase family 9 protein [Chitinophaga sedimenti]|uniref:glycoside hydrolase family 9 protein n=1 Tax=Chitinophaga sedimenti TaxID=2033606 RepID=UPI0020067D36|nr:glycoside hydrolase family 9 protein [Chitinophaga sedimenti]MCK7557300.1 glycoside hydrolase family 9 protein [Chitinophaga sedimenti]
MADFTGLQHESRYKLVCVAGPSPLFYIARHPHEQAGQAAMKAFYYQRASMPLERAYAGQWAREAGHPDNIVLLHPSTGQKGKISSPEGWYDAGDYNKYIVNSGITMGTLLSLYEDYPQYCKGIRLNIPESNNKIPDILDEVSYNLRWMLTMQDPADGGVYHKLTNASFDGMIMPEQATQPRYVVKKSTAATLDFAAVTAQAARVYAKIDKPLALACREAATKAWQWALQHPKEPYRQDEMNKQFQPPVVTGEYGNAQFDDELSWAAAELFTTTKDEQYRPHINRMAVRYWQVPSWGQVGVLAYYTMARYDAGMKKDVIAFADNLLSGSDSTTYQVVMGKKAGDFTWGSNSVVANQGIALMQAYKFTKDKRYLNGAVALLDYLMGRNATGYCYLTGFGSKRVMHPHHRVSVADGIPEPVPGLLAGGPNPGMQDKCTTYVSKVPDEAYTDDDCSYASNEIAINWNAPLVYLIWAIEAAYPR